MRRAAIVILVLIAIGVALLSLRQPSLRRNWAPDQTALPVASIDGDRVTVRNVRNFEYRSEASWSPRYDTRTYDLGKLDSLWYAVERFGGHEGIAHTFLSFGFGDEYVAISVEIRKERGESYSPWRGLAREYELMYVIGDERDILGLRTNHRRDEVRLYPVRATRVQMRALFLDMIGRANELAREPEFYNTLTNTCTTNIVRHVNAIAPKKVPFSFRVLLPAYSDALAFDLGLIDTTLPLDRARVVYRVDDDAQQLGITPDFSQRIRARLPPS